MAKRANVFPGAVVKAFFADESETFWPQGSHVDEDVYIVDGVEVSDDFDSAKLDDSAAVEVVSGFIVLESGDTKDLLTQIRKWVKIQNTERMFIEFPKEKRAEVAAALAAVGVKLP
ncbi:Uncharacterised protein [Achromobacter sp. 2789STDY5608633]|uniref:hypothetical protein n=1 Tax=Achromobacter sp. 2789STDY5608633 TaxID=1806501 RepID=UPI0006BF785E|nr:hypothetical protein [Achromobacter sp. 2789STDY5608633]CUJ49994.1 Uncharacterised protein [Achromobacter sp. 2789STDY5608633]